MPKERREGGRGMIVDTDNVFESLLKNPSLLKCVGIERIIPAYEFTKARMPGEDVKKIEERWLLDRIAKGLIEHNLVKFETERMGDGNVKISCLVYAVDPKADISRTNYGGFTRRNG